MEPDRVVAAAYSHIWIIV